MRKDQKNSYIQRGGAMCPHCGLSIADRRIVAIGARYDESDERASLMPEVSADTRPDIPPGASWVRWSCGRCGRAWDDFTLAGSISIREVPGG